MVGPPLRRPPPGWDDPGGVAEGRWAWGMEPPGEVQLNLAPRCVLLQLITNRPIVLTIVQTCGVILEALLYVPCCTAVVVVNTTGGQRTYLSA